jgi:hypothetical protein
MNAQRKNPIPADMWVIKEMFDIVGGYRQPPPDLDLWVLGSQGDRTTGIPSVELIVLKDKGMTTKRFEEYCISPAGRERIRIEATKNYPDSFDYWGGFNAEIQNPVVDLFKACPERVRTPATIIGTEFKPHLYRWPKAFLVCDTIAIAYRESKQASTSKVVEDMISVALPGFSPTDTNKAKQTFGGAIRLYRLRDVVRLPENWHLLNFANFDKMASRLW